MAKKKDIEETSEDTESEEETTEEDLESEEVEVASDEEVNLEEEAEDSEKEEKQETQMWKMKCSECGNESEVPFQPAEGRPVYCRDCFMKRRRPTRNFGYNRRY
ncbi:MAG: CxxC-x17-CxxC domain-containing protein [archaeon]